MSVVRQSCAAPVQALADRGASVSPTRSATGPKRRSRATLAPVWN